MDILLSEVKGALLCADEDAIEESILLLYRMATSESDRELWAEAYEIFVGDAPPSVVLAETENLVHNN